MSNGKPQSKKDPIDNQINQSRLIKKAFGQARIIKSGVSNVGSTVGMSRPSVGTSVSGTSYLKTQGDSMIGPLAFKPYIVIPASNAITINSASNKYSSYIIVGTPATTINTIYGAGFNGQILFLQGVTTITHILGTSGNIQTIDGTNYSLVDDDVIILIFDIVVNKWKQITRGRSTVSGGANTTLSNLSLTTTINTDLLPASINSSALGTSLLPWSSVVSSGFKLITATGTNTSTADMAIYKHTTYGLTLKSSTVDSSFGRTVFADKDGVIRVDFNYDSVLKNFKFNYATGGFAIRHNASDMDALLIYSVGNNFSSNNMLINANGGFGAGDGLLIQRDSVDKIKIDGNINLLVDTYLSGDVYMNGNDIFSVKTIIPMLTNSAYTIGLDSTNNRWHSSYLNAIYTQGINLRDTALTSGQTGVIEFINTIGINAVSVITNARFRFEGLDPAIQIGNAYYVDTNDSSSLRSHTTGMLHESASGATPKILALLAWDEFVFRGYGEVTTDLSRGALKAMRKAGDITTSELPSGFMCFVKNTTSGQAYVAYNDGGTIKKALAT